MKSGHHVIAPFALATLLAIACSEGSQEDDSASGGSSGTAGTSNGKGGSSGSSGSSSRGGDAGAGASSNTSGGQGNAGESNGTSDAGQGGAPGSAGSNGTGGSPGEAGAPGQGSGGASSDPCGGCDSGQTCIYQVGGPGPSQGYLCAEEPPCAAPAACACITGQGTCSFVPEDGICVCDNGLD